MRIKHPIVDWVSAHIEKLQDSKTIILGIGNVLKGDDAFGPLVCEKLKIKNISTEVIDAATVPENYIQTIIRKSPQILLIIDAIDFSAMPGSIRVFEPEELNSLVISTHTLSPKIFIDMIRQSIELDVFIIGVQPAQTQLGSPLSPQIKKSIFDLVDILRETFTTDLQPKN